MNEAIILTLRSGYGEFGMWETCYTYGELLRYTFGVTDKVDDVVYLVTHRDLVFNLLQGILYAEVSLIHQAVSIYDMAQNTVGDLMLCVGAPLH